MAPALTAEVTLSNANDIIDVWGKEGASQAFKKSAASRISHILAACLVRWTKEGAPERVIEKRKRHLSDVCRFLKRNTVLLLFRGYVL